MVPYICAADFNCFVMNARYHIHEKITMDILSNFHDSFCQRTCIWILQGYTIKDKSMVAAAYSVYFSLKNLG